MSGLWRFHGGLHVEGHKAPACDVPVARALPPPYVVLPLLQHIGATVKPVVKPGERVLAGQMIAHCGVPGCQGTGRCGTHSAPVHASISGTVVAVEARLVPHPSGLEALCMVIESDGEDRWAELSPIEDYLDVELEELRHRVAMAGMVGLGGAGFPSYLKLQPGTIHTLILNGAECEPYISCDDRLMRERPEEILRGLKILARGLGQPKRCIIALEDNKPEAFAALKRALSGAEGSGAACPERSRREGSGAACPERSRREGSGVACPERSRREGSGVEGSAARGMENVEIVQVPTLYPMGGERQLIRVLTGIEVAFGTLPAHRGVVMHNVATAAAIYRAVRLGEPLISRIVTLTGDALAAPRNLEVRLGTPIKFLLEQCGQTAPAHLLMGGPMMGISLSSAELPVIKTTNCIIASRDAPGLADPMPCIRCGACEQVCPIQLLPQQLYWYSRAKDFDQARAYNLFDCIECGCCAYVCPSRLPLVQYFRFAKSEIRQAEKDKQRSERARQRHEFRLFRIERDKAERQARHQQKAAALKGGDEQAKKAAIAAALAEGEAKKPEKQETGNA